MEKIMSNKVNNRIYRKLLFIGLLLLALPLAACNTMAGTAAAAPTDQIETSAPLAVAEAPVTAPVEAQAAPVKVPAESIASESANGASEVTSPTLSEDEIADLLFMREEEKLARDLYLAFYELWGIPVFQNIAASEQVHMDAVLNLIGGYGLQDPVGNNEPGVFVDATLQALYEQLLAAGNQSAVDALYAAAAVEEVDILDLEGSLAQTNKDDIVAVYHQLLAGSENHLRAFVSSWERQTSQTYQPQRLSQEAYAAIMDGDLVGAGNGPGQGAGQGGNGQGGNGQGAGQGGGNGKGYRGGRGGDGSVDNGPGGPGGRGAQ
jgi:hypothetical protein